MMAGEARKRGERNVGQQFLALSGRCATSTLARTDEVIE
jgi:hypothetical protein